MIDRLKRIFRPRRRIGLLIIPPVLVTVGVVLTLAGIGPNSSSVHSQSAIALPPQNGVDATPVSPLPAFTASGLASRNSDAPGSPITVQVTRTWPFDWPAQGPITSYMGPEHPWGIDIGLSYDYDSPILATAAGTVTFAGGSPADDYGYHVMIDHGEGIVTVYAHLSIIFVKEGQQVAQGKLLGFGGQTGKATGKHLHFEVRDGEDQIDPLHVLPDPGTEPPPLTLNCADSALVIDQGSVATLDFASTLTGGFELETAKLEPVSVRPDAPPIDVSIKSGRYVVVATHPSMRGADQDDDLHLEVTRASDQEVDVMQCDVHIHAVEQAPSFYVRVYTDDGTADAPLDDTPTPVPPGNEDYYPTMTPTSQPSATATPRRAATPTPTRTRIPTVTPRPTNTPIPTSTRIPTATRIPTSTAVPTATKIP